MRKRLMLLLMLPCFCGCYTVLRTAADVENAAVEIEIAVEDRWTQYEAGDAWWQTAGDEDDWTLLPETPRYGRRNNVVSGSVNTTTSYPTPAIGYTGSVFMPATLVVGSTAHISTPATSMEQATQKESTGVQPSKKEARTFGVRSTTKSSGKKNR